ncbi:glycine zipper 2TM domain-containing protein [Oleiagrimonas sp.]|jgi:uncharacterized protein YcfJ|uniref:glycine zipper 2TM domain-containing protein n=1 Tax=Oleiagrimonas sp. TaxID=2010330 RepID=UPI00261A72EB|nr:glycine zipper 2TM domain-containing protein [Oleiagrimonas sp.]MDA3914302.1 glycine zipper 2TM domain-containing protein [Oleiagrimonas sp.]
MKQLIASLTLITALVASTVVLADPPWARGHDERGDRHDDIAYVRVLDVRPIHDPIYARERVCRMVPIEERTVVGGQRQAAATVLGAVIGGALGNTVGKGDGRRAATIAGAVVGGAIGHESTPGEGRRVYARRAYQRRCHMRSYYAGDRVVAYAVSYWFHGRVLRTRRDHPPGRFMRVRVHERVWPEE